jgi:hypothetical protein
MNACSIYEPPTILKMNFNFNFKDMPGGKEASIRIVTNACDLHHTGKTEERMDFAGITSIEKSAPKTANRDRAIIVAPCVCAPHKPMIDSSGFLPPLRSVRLERSRVRQ